MEIPVACFKDVALPPQLQSVDISIFKSHGFRKCAVIDQSTASQIVDFLIYRHVHAPVSCIFDHFHHFALCLNAIQNFVFNFARLLNEMI